MSFPDLGQAVGRPYNVALIGLDPDACAAYAGATRAAGLLGNSTVR